METKCKTCKTTIDFSSCHLVDNDNVMVCKFCYDRKLYEPSKANDLKYYNKVSRGNNAEEKTT